MTFFFPDSVAREARGAGTSALNSENSASNQNEGFKGTAGQFFKEPKTLISFSVKRGGGEKKNAR